jgi:hypothetical protein
LKEAVKALLELFVEKADKLRQQEFTQFLEEFGQQLRYMADPQHFTVSTVAPTQTMTDSFLLTYRMFVQGSEHMRFIDPTKAISKELLDSSISPQWLAEVQDVAQKVHTFLGEKPIIPIVFNLIDQQGNMRTESPTRWDILETLLYGDRSHATSAQRKRLKNWLSTPYKEQVEELLMMNFINILAVTLSAIQHLAYFARIELGLPPNA